VPLFQGHSTQEQIELIIGLLGTPEEEEIAKVKHESCRAFLESIPRKCPRQFAEVFSGVPPKARDFLSESLHWDAKSRMTVEAALQHPYLQELHYPEDEPTRAPLDTADFEFEHQDMSSKELRQDLFREILQYHPEVGDQSSDDELESCASDSSWQLDTGLMLRGFGRQVTF